MSVFVEKGSSDEEVYARVRRKYGDSARIMSRKEYRKGGMLGFFGKKVVEFTGYTRAILRNSSASKSELEDKKTELLQSVQKDKKKNVLVQVLEEVQELKSQLSTDSKGEQPSLARIRNILLASECTVEYIEYIMQKVRQQFSLEALQDETLVDRTVMKWIAESILTSKLVLRRSPQVVTIIGPTGVGKTTTIAKLVAQYSISEKKKVGVITIDNYRIGATAQIKTYGEIMNIPVKSAESADSLAKQLGLFKGYDLVFIDTIGKSPLDFSHLGEMKEVLRNGAPNSQVLLCISATTKVSDAREIIRQYDPFQVSSLIITKMDETACGGNIVSIIHESQKPVIFLTTGQKVPSDMEFANALPFLLRFLRFSLDREEITTTFEGGSPTEEK